MVLMHPEARAQYSRLVLYRVINGDGPPLSVLLPNNSHDATKAVYDA